MLVRKDPSARAKLKRLVKGVSKYGTATKTDLLHCSYAFAVLTGHGLDRFAILPADPRPIWERPCLGLVRDFGPPVKALR